MIGIVITMYDEADIVARTIRTCKPQFAEFVVVHSDNEVQSPDLDYIKQNAVYIPLPNLGKQLSTHEIAAAAICRNYNTGFSRLYEMGNRFEGIIGMTGDTLISDLRKVIAMTSSGYLGYVLQAKGQGFYDRNDRPGIDSPSRVQTEEVNDFMPQFFMFDGYFCYVNKLFTRIVNANPYTSEENLGNEVERVLGEEFRKKVKRIHTRPNVYDYHEGIEFQLKGLGHTRKGK